MNSLKRITLDRFDSNDDLVVKSYYNLKPTSVLENAMEIEEARFPLGDGSDGEYTLDYQSSNITSVDGINYFKQYFPNNGVTVHRLLVYGGDKKMYFNQLSNQDDSLYSLYNLTFNNPPIALAFKQNGADVIILSDGSTMKIWKTNYTPYTVENTPIITSMAIQGSILFCTVKDPAYKVWFCRDFDAERVGDVTSISGYISLEDELGYSRRVVTLNDSVYVFRDYGISKITFFKNEWNISQVYKSNTMIYSNTISVCGNEIVFAMGDGLYSFGGAKVSKLNIDIGSLKISSLRHAVSSSLGNKYYLACKIDYRDALSSDEAEYHNNVVLYIDAIDHSVGIIRGVDVKAFLPLKTDAIERMYVVFNSGTFRRIGQIVTTTDDTQPIGITKHKSWTGYMINLDAGHKVFTRLIAKCNIGVSFRLHYDGGVKELVSYKDGYNSFTFRLQANEMTLEIDTNRDRIKVENVSLDYY